MVALVSERKAGQVAAGPAKESMLVECKQRALLAKCTLSGTGVREKSWNEYVRENLESIGLSLHLKRTMIAQNGEI